MRQETTNARLRQKNIRDILCDVSGDSDAQESFTRQSLGPLPVTIMATNKLLSSLTT